MQDLYFDKLAMFKTSLGVAADHRIVWTDNKPLRFGILFKTATDSVAALDALATAQRAELTGIAEQKEREEAELEEIAFEISQALAEFFEDHGRESDRAEVDLSESAWIALRDEDLLAKTNTLGTKLGAALQSPDATKLADDYGIDAADLEKLQKERADFDEIVHSPKEALANRKAKTAALHREFRAVSALFNKLDRQAVQFRKRGPQGRAFHDAWRAARRIRHTGGGSPTQDKPTPPAAT